MKKLFFLLVAISLLYVVTSCSKKDPEPQKWEYKTLAVWGESYSDFHENYIGIPQYEMDSLGAHGWELVDVYTRIETAHPNFGHKEYVTGINANTRTSAVFYVFKRPLREGHFNDETKSEDVCDSVVIEATSDSTADFSY